MAGLVTLPSPISALYVEAGSTTTTTSRLLRAMRGIFGLLAVAGTAAAFSVTCGRNLPALSGRARSHTCSPSLSLSKEGQQLQASIFVDEQAMLKDRAFPLTPEDMITRSKAFLESRGGFGADPELIADDFQFMGPVVSLDNLDNF